MTDKEEKFQYFLKILETKNNRSWKTLLEQFLDSGEEIKICSTCNAPNFGHIDTHCRETKAQQFTDEVALFIEKELFKEAQNIFKAKMAKNVVGQSVSMSVGGNETLTAILSKLSESLVETQNFQKTWMEKNESKVYATTSKLVKPPRPPMWTKEMVFDTFQKQVQRWSSNEKQVSEVDKYHELIEELKKNKEIEGLSKYVNDQIVETCNNENEQTIDRILEVLKAKFGRTELEKIEQLCDLLVNTKIDKQDANDSKLEKLRKVVDFATKDIDISKKVPQFLGTWMLQVLKRSESLDAFEVIQLRKSIKENKTTNIKDFCDLFRELKIEGKRDDSFIQDKPAIISNYIGKESSSRRRYQEQRSRSRGRDRSMSRGRSQTRGRSQSFRNDSRSRNNQFGRNFSKGREYERCIGCQCKECKDNRDVLKSLKEESLNKRSSELNVKFIENAEIEVRNEFLIHYSEKDDNIMVVDNGAPASLAGKSWIEKYLKQQDLEIDDLVCHPCHQLFRFGPSTRYLSEKVIEIPIYVIDKDGRKDLLVVKTYVLNADSPFLCGNNTLYSWQAKIDIKNNVLETVLNGKQRDYGMIKTAGGHNALILELKEKDEEIIHYLERASDEEDIITNFKGIKKVHEVTNHKSANNLIHAYRNANLITPAVVKTIKDVVRRCKICEKMKRSMSKPKIALPKAQDFNQIVTLDLKEMDGKYILWMICSFTRFMLGKVLPNKKAETILEALNSKWNYMVGFPSEGYWADNGGEFANVKMDELCSKLNMKIKFGPSYSPWSNGINERNHAAADITIKKLLNDSTLKLKLTDDIVNAAAWTHNSNINKLGYSPLQLATGKAVTIPGLTMGNVATDSSCDAESVKRIMERHSKMITDFREVDMRNKLKDCQRLRVMQYQHRRPFIQGDKVWYQHKDCNAWLGPAEVHSQQGQSVWIYSMGDIRKVAACKVKPYDVEEFESKTNVENIPVILSNSDSEEFNQEKDSRSDAIGAYYMKLENHMSSDPISVMVVEVPVAEHGLPEVVAAKENEIENLRTYETFEEVSASDIPNNVEVIGSRWVITKKEKFDGQKQIIKARLVCRGFQENDKPQSDSPAVLKESFKMCLAIAANEGFSIASVDIRAAFLQAKTLDRNVFVKPPKDIAKNDILWRLKKPLYGLDDASRKFWLRVRNMFLEMKFKIIEGDEAFYYLRENDQLRCMILTHVDDFIITGTERYVTEVIRKISEVLTVSKVEYGSFRFTGVDVKQVQGGIEVSMDDYVESLEKNILVRNAKRDDELTKLEMKLYRKMTGKVAWIAENVRPDLCFTALSMSKKSNCATIADLRRLDKVIAKVKENPAKVLFSKVGSYDQVQILGIGDASYKCDDKSVGGNFVLLGNLQNGKCSPMFWKSKQISRTAHSSKDAETLNMSKLVDDSVSLARQVEILLHGSYKGVIPVKLYTDSEPTLESIASSKQVERKLLRNTVKDLKDKVLSGEVKSMSWLATEDMLADILTKEKKMSNILKDLLIDNKFQLKNMDFNVVKAVDGELRMFNIRNRDIPKDS